MSDEETYLTSIEMEPAPEPAAASSDEPKPEAPKNKGGRPRKADHELKGPRRPSVARRDGEQLDDDDDDQPKKDPRRLPVAAPRPRATLRKEPGTAANPYAQLDVLKKQVQTVVSQIRREHPNAVIGDYIDPRDAQVKVSDTPMFPKEIAAHAIGATYDLAAEMFGVEHRPSQESLNKVAEAWAEWSRYWGGGKSPASAAAISAITCTGMLFSPVLAKASSKGVAALIGTKDEVKS